MTAAWPAPTAPRPVRAIVALPGSKSVTNRALLIAALTEGTSRLVAPLRSRDTDLMAAALRALGTRVDDDGADWLVTGPLDRVDASARSVDVGNAGTVARFLPAVCALTRHRVTLDGDPRIRERPVAPLVRALRSLGAQVDGEALPLVVHGAGAVRGGSVEVDAAQSSQFVSGLLLAAPLFDHGVEVAAADGVVPSAPHIRMTTALMRERGAGIDEAGGAWRVQPGAYAPGELVVEPDLSGASAFLGAAAATAGSVTVRGWPAATWQPGASLPALLETMGCRQSRTADGLRVDGPDALTGIDVDLRDAPELVPVLAALCALATTPSRLTGIAHLRVQETDRLAALATEINRLGGDVDELPDGLAIRPAPLHGGLWHCYDDHRLAMAAAVIGLTVPGVELDDVATTAKTMPDFPQRWADMLGTDQ